MHHQEGGVLDKTQTWNPSAKALGRLISLQGQKNPRNSGNDWTPWVQYFLVTSFSLQQISPWFSHLFYLFLSVVKFLMLPDIISNGASGKEKKTKQNKNNYSQGICVCVYVYLYIKI